MKKSELEALRDVIAEAESVADRVLEGELIDRIKGLIAKAGAQLPYQVALSVELSVFDDERTNGVKLLQTSICSAELDEPYRAFGDSAIGRYLVEGEMCELPHDYCPLCWAAWDFKLKNRTCGECGATLGQEVRILIDNDLCPSCEEGTVTADSPKCTRCEFEATSDIVWWG